MPPAAHTIESIFAAVEIGRLRYVGTAPALEHCRAVAALSPRLRQTLECLLEGDGEKQVAARLGLSRHTVHEYVGQLYRRFGVCSRPELLALCLRAGTLRAVPMPPAANESVALLPPGPQTSGQPG